MPRSPRSHPRQFISIQTIAGVVAQRRRSRPRPAFRRELNDTARMIAHRLTRGPHKNTMAEAVARRLRRRSRILSTQSRARSLGGSSEAGAAVPRATYVNAIAVGRSPRLHPRQFISIQTIAGVVAQRRRSRPRPAFRRELNDTARMIAHRLTRGPHKNTMAEAVARRLRRRRQNPIDAIATQVTRRLQRSSAESEVTAETIVNAGASEQIP